EIEPGCRREFEKAPALERETVPGVSLRLLEHRLGAVDPERRAEPLRLVQDLGQLARSAAEVDGAPARNRLHQGEEVVERARALRLESLILSRVPHVHVPSIAGRERAR